MGHIEYIPGVNEGDPPIAITHVHPRDQWFRIYEYIPGEVGIVVSSKDPSKVESLWKRVAEYRPIEKTVHLIHPDAYHPDPRVKIAHHRDPTRRKYGLHLTGCEMVHDDRMRLIEPHDEADRCPKCLANRERAIIEHEKAIEEDRQKREVNAILVLAEQEKKE